MLKEKKIEEYNFKPLFKETKIGVEDFQFDAIDRELIISKEEHGQHLKIEREYAESNSFSIAPIVREHRGINKQERDEREMAIENEVVKRVKKIEEDAFNKGFEQGVLQGKEEVFNQTKAESEEKLSFLTNMINEVLVTQAELVQSERIAIQKTIRNLTKWVILRELKDDGEYIERLLEKLIEDLQTKNNLLVQVNPQLFNKMPDILEHVERVLGKLENIRVEADYDIAGPGIIVNSDNGIINGTLTEQFKSIDLLFEKTGVERSDDNYHDALKTLSINEEVSEDESLVDLDTNYGENQDDSQDSSEDDHNGDEGEDTE